MRYKEINKINAVKFPVTNSSKLFHFSFLFEYILFHYENYNIDSSKTKVTIIIELLF